MIDTLNRQMVASQMTRNEALTFAAWLVTMAELIDEPLDRLDPMAQSVTFAEVLEAVQNT